MKCKYIISESSPFFYDLPHFLSFSALCFYHSVVYCLLIRLTWFTLWVSSFYATYHPPSRILLRRITVWGLWSLYYYFSVSYHLSGNMFVFAFMIIVPRLRTIGRFLSFRLLDSMLYFYFLCTWNSIFFMAFNFFWFLLKLRFFLLFFFQFRVFFLSNSNF